MVKEQRLTTGRMFAAAPVLFLQGIDQDVFLNQLLLPVSNSSIFPLELRPMGVAQHESWCLSPLELWLEIPVISTYNFYNPIYRMYNPIEITSYNYVINGHIGLILIQKTKRILVASPTLLRKCPKTFCRLYHG